MGNLDSLPLEIILDILKRLEIDSVLHYRLVSRKWNYLVYHRLLDYLEQTQVALERKVKRLKSGPPSSKGSIYFKILDETMKSVKQGIINAQKISGGSNALFESGKLLQLKKETDIDVQRLDLLNRWEQIEAMILI